MADKTTIKALFVAPGQDPMEVDIEPTLKVFQRLVGGYIETIEIGNRVVLICNEDGKLGGIPNRRIYKWMTFETADIIFGPFIICGTKGEDFVGLSQKQIDKYAERLSYPGTLFID